MADILKLKDNGGGAPEDERIPGEAPTLPLYFGLSSLGSSGLKESGGWIYEEFLPQLVGGKAARFYDEMSKNSATLGAIRQLVRYLTRQVEWSTLPNERAADQIMARREAEHIEGCFDDMEHSYSDMISEALTMLEFGFAPMVLTYKLRRGPNQPPEFASKFKDGRFGWRSIELRSQDSLDRWEFNADTRKLTAMWQYDTYAPRRQSTRIPIERLALFRTESTKNNPEGRSFFRNAVVSYLRLKHVETIEAIGVDRELTGLPVMEVPLKILQANNADVQALAIKRELERQLGSLKRHEREFLIMPTADLPDGAKSGYKFSLLQSPGGGRVNVVEIKNTHKTDIFQACLAQFLQLGQNTSGGGSRALSSDQTDLFSLSMYSILETIRETIQRQCIDRLCTLNNVEPDLIPQISFGDIETPNLGQMGTYITALHNAGVLVPDEELNKRLYEIAGLPYKNPADDVIPADQLMAEARGEGKLSIGEGATSTGGELNVELLNGAQLASLVSVVDAMAAGTLPMDSAATILTATLGIDSGTVNNILQPVEDKLLSTGPMAPGAMMPNGQPGETPGAPPGAPMRVVAPHELGDPASQGDMPGGVKSADQLVGEVMKVLISKRLANAETAARAMIARIKGR